MQVTELSAEGLKREYKVVVGADEIEDRISGRLGELSKTIRMAGFRPGKVPVSLLRKQYGRSVMGEVVEKAVTEGSQQAISDNELRPAMQPKIEVTSFDEGADLEFTVAVEVLPEVPSVDLKGIALTRPTAAVTDEAVEERAVGIAESNRDYKEPAEARASETGDRITVDFKGEVDGEPFEGGAADDFPLVLGSGSMIPGFEDQLIGKQVGEDVTVEVTFPEAYGAKELAGKAARFAVKVKEIAEPQAAEPNDEVAKKVGFDDLAAMKDKIREQIEQGYGQYSRMRVKRALLDHLADNCKFEVPAGMVEAEFNAIWQQIKQNPEMAAEGADASEAGASEAGASEAGAAEADAEPDEETRKEYQDIAERRVRLGLILSDIGQANDLKVEQPELDAAVMGQARRFPGQEAQVIEYFKNNPQAVDQLRAPIYEDKVVDFILQLANVTDQELTPEELMKDPDEEEVKEAEDADSDTKSKSAAAAPDEKA
ncbi:MAG: trigger factor [Pseudomonadota bacterium]